MRIKLDENLPATLVEILERLDHDVDTVPGEGLTAAPDPTVWQAAQEAERFFVTHDIGFGDLRTYQPGTHEGVLLLRLPEAPRRVIEECILRLFTNEDVERWLRCMVVATASKVRVRRPAEGSTR